VLIQGIRYEKCKFWPELIGDKRRVYWIALSNVRWRRRFIAQNRRTSPSMNKYERKHATMRDKNEFEHE